MSDKPKLITSRELDRMSEKDQNALLAKVEEGNRETPHTVTVIEVKS